MYLFFHSLTEQKQLTQYISTWNAVLLVASWEAETRTVSIANENDVS